jgi:alpha/beta hydrolase fold
LIFGERLKLQLRGHLYVKSLAIRCLWRGQAGTISRSAESISGHTGLLDIKVFYREAGPLNAPAILLLHGFPTSSHMFRNLIPELADNYHVVAPDLPGFGFSDAPDRKSYRYTFEQLAETIAAFTQNIGQ